MKRAKTSYINLRYIYNFSRCNIFTYVKIYLLETVEYSRNIYNLFIKIR